MPSAVFLTGGSGFVGRSVVRGLARAGFPDVRLLTRRPRSIRFDGPAPAGWRLVEGALENPEAWASHLNGVESVLHLGAATGKVRAAAQYQVTRDGTRGLLEVAQRAGVRRFLFVSSVAAGYQDRSYYHYADAKAAAEASVAGSTRDALIVRPTLVLGPGSPLLASLRRLACLPIPLLFGDGRPVVQPVHVEDLAELLVAALGWSAWDRSPITVGGPERLTIDDLMVRIRAAARGDHPRLRHIPVGPARTALALLEPILFPLLPFTAGQLAFFANPSVATSALPAALPAPSRGIEDMLRDPARG